MTTRALAILSPLAAIFAMFSIDDTLAQQQPSNTIHMQCVTASQISADTVETVVMVDSDGDRWSKMRVRGTGRTALGFWHKHGVFCIVTTGTEAKES